MSNNRAMTLAEILIATVLIGIIAAGMARVFVFSKVTAHKSSDKIVALGDVRAKVLEKIAGGVITGKYNCAKENKAVTNYAGVSDTSEFFGSLQGEGYRIEANQICTGATAATNYINYCYKPVQFTVEWEKRE